ncbi:MAG: ABC transporter permease [Oscillospiraceae bacterium]|nr:ABC transporter permease [Oscillospiraceae bacterium]
MKFGDLIRMCFRNLFKRKMRTALTVLGVIIGTCAIVVMVSLGVGMDDAMDKMVSEWADLTMIQVYNWGGLRPDGTEIPPLTDEVITDIKAIDHVKAATPFLTSLWIGDQVAIYNDDYAIQSAAFIGVYMDELENFGYKISEGRFKEAGDPEATVLVGQNFGVYGYDYVFDEWVGPSWPDDYDDEGNPTKKMVDPMKSELHIIPLTVKVEESGGFRWGSGGDYSVIGSATAPNAEYDKALNVVGIIEGNWNDWYTMEGMFVDIEFLSYYLKAYNELNPDFQYYDFEGTYDNVRIRVDDMNNVKAVEDAINEMGYETWSAGEARENMKSQVQLIQMLLAALAGVSLFVAALNITNTMITAVIERTREIGIMKVLGCDVSKILGLFLGEAALIGFIGGVLGVGLSYIISTLFNSFLFEEVMKMLSGGGGYGMGFEEGVVISQIPLWLSLGGLAFATVVGVLAGFYPSFRGTRISALSAIAYE